MPTYEYKCAKCGLRFERSQTMTEDPITECPECHGKVRRLISGGTGFIMRESDRGGESRSGHACSLEQVGKTCCGREERCGKPPCGERE
jgi:putative FmdB family regulatory protein